MKARFRNRVVVVTGANAGIGRQLSLRFAQAGAWVALLDLQLESLQALANQIEHLNTKALALKCDVSDPEAVQNAMQHVLQHFGGVDVLINNAGITHRGAFAKTDIEILRKVMDTNFYGSLYCTKALLPSVIERKGQIITMSSRSVNQPLWHRSAYSASKHALHGLFDSLRMELSEQGVNVMMVCPGYTATDMRRNELRGDDAIASSNSFSLIGPLASPVDVADAVYEAALCRKSQLVLSNVSWRGHLIAWLFPKWFGRLMASHQMEQAQGDAAHGK